MTGPYAAAAWLYRKAGWQGVIPVGRGPAQKSPPPTGYTGWAGIDPSGADIQTWIDDREGAYNIGLHVPAGVVVVDVDAYHGGAETLAALTARVGRPLPPTYSNTARGQHAQSRHHFYRAALPAEHVWRDHPGGSDGGIDVLHVGHRYAVVWPSVNPQAGGATYEWYGPDGEPCGIPSPDRLPELPPEWVTELSQAGVPLEGSAASDAETLDVVHRFRAGPACPRVVRLLREELDRIGAALRGAGGLHMPGPLYALTAYGLEGHAGVAAALSHHQDVYTAARVASRGESQGFADAEWWRQVRGAVGKKLSANGGVVLGDCDCGGARPRHAGGEGLPIPGVTPGDMETLRAELAAIVSPAERLARARAAAAALAGLPDAELLAWRDMLKEVAKLTHGDFAIIVKAERAADAEQARAEQDAARNREGPQLPHRAAPMPVARALHLRFVALGRHLRFWRGDWYLWYGTHYRAVSAAAIRAMIYESTEPCWYEDPEDGPKPWNPDTAAVNKVLDAFAHGPAYRPDESDEDRCIAAANGVLDLASGQLLPHTPDRFNLWSLPYGYDPHARAPQWETFLAQVVPDLENRQLLREWFGYMISGRTDLQKILSLFGAPRSGKGTVMRVLVALMGEANRATVTLGQLASVFGCESLIGRTMAQITDANWNIREIDTAVEALKAISGEDDRGVDRKNRTTWEGRLGVRFVLVANPMPKFNDPSGALLSRMLHIEFTRSFIGVEDETLTPRLLTELPGILNWALGGLSELNVRGKLIVPQASREAAEDIERTTSPVAAFLRDRVRFVDRAMCVGVYLDEVHAAFVDYCHKAEITRPTSREVFARDLRAAGTGRIDIKRVWLDRGTPAAHRVGMVFGLALAGETHAGGGGAPPLRR